MGRWMRRNVTVQMVVMVVTGVIASAAGAQTMGGIRGEVTDEWGNGLADVSISGQLTGDERTAAGDPREETTNDDGRFNFRNLQFGDWVVEFRADGYQPTAVAVTLDSGDRLIRARPLEIELAAAPPGSRVRDDLEFESEDGALTLALKNDGTFEFEDAEGEGEGTYGIVELEGRLTVRDYDGDDDKFSITEPVVITFPNELYNSLTWGDATLMKQ